MSDRLNQHFVPRHHLRLYAGGRRFLSAVLRGTGALVQVASIRGQCARHNYYGDSMIEEELSLLEGRHAPVFRAAREYVWSDGPKLTVMQRYRLREALLLQHSRTPRRAMLRASSMNQLMMNVYREYLASGPKTRENRRLLRDIGSGEVSLQLPEVTAVRFAITTAVQSVQLTMDLNIHFLRNRTECPFLLGDSPCVFSNHYMRDVKGIGVTGLTHRGLMIVMPLDPQTSILMVDSAVYHPTLPPIVDTVNLRDVEVLNALQVYEAVDCVYLAEPDCAEYACMLVADHPRTDSDGLGGFDVVPSSSVYSRPRGELLHIFEPAPPITLDLSFLATDTLPNSQNLLEPRCRDLLDRFAPSEYLSGSSLPIEELVKWVRPRLAVRER